MSLARLPEHLSYLQDSYEFLLRSLSDRAPEECDTSLLETAIRKRTYNLTPCEAEQQIELDRQRLKNWIDESENDRHVALIILQWLDPFIVADLDTES